MTWRGGAGFYLIPFVETALPMQLHLSSWPEIETYLARYREAGKVDKHQYHSLYMQVKGARYKTKRALMETIHRMKEEAGRTKALADQATAAKAKAESKKDKKPAARTA